MTAVRFQRIFVIAGIVSLFAAYLGVWVKLISEPVERTGSDFIAFYSAGRVAQTYGFSKVYQPELQQDVQEEQVGFPLVKGQVLLYNHLPFLLPVLRLLVNNNYVSSFYLWVFLLCIVYCATLVILGKVLQTSGIDKQTVWLVSVGAFLFL